MQSTSIPRWVRFALCAIVGAGFVVGQAVHTNFAEQAGREAQLRADLPGPLVHT